jgi:putative transposase
MINEFMNLRRSLE